MAVDVLRMDSVHTSGVAGSSLALASAQGAAAWPIADGRIESVEVNKPKFSFTTKRGYYVAELGYSYSVAGTLNSGRYKREFPKEQEADEFVRDLQNKAVAVHFDPGKPSSSALLTPDIEAILQNRAPSPLPDFPFSADSIQIGSSLSFGSSSAFLPLVLSSVYGFIWEP